jgi:EAL domain-containing protein (putative c-di-GMP-specific phosphodiesterase class I)
MVSLYRREEEIIETARRQLASGAPLAGAATLTAESPLTIHDVVQQRLVTAEFQPIVRLDTGESVGFEAFARGPAGELSNPGALFGAAGKAGVATELDQVAHAAAYRAALRAKLNPSQSLFVNADPTTLGRAIPDDLADVYALAVTRLRLFIDVSERHISGDPSASLAGLARVRAAGWGVSWDNAGTTPDSLALMPLIRPDVVKIDVSLVQDRSHPFASRVVNAAIAYAENAGAAIMAVGIESDEHLTLARGMGASLGQGYYFARPAELPEQTKPVHQPIPLIDQLEPSQPHETPFDVYASRYTPTPASDATLESFAHYLEQRCSIDPEPPVVLACLKGAQLPSGAPLALLGLIARNSSFAAAFAEQLPPHPIPGVRTIELADNDPLAEEWALAIVGPHFAALLTARRRDTTTEETLSLGLSYHRPTVLRAAQTLLHRITAP